VLSSLYSSQYSSEAWLEKMRGHIRTDPISAIPHCFLVALARDTAALSKLVEDTRRIASAVYSGGPNTAMGGRFPWDAMEAFFSEVVEAI
jgi:hypothetical protein